MFHTFRVRVADLYQVTTILVFTMFLSGPAKSQDFYEDVIDSQNPVLYWNLGESGGTTADNLGSTGSANDGTYGSVVVLGESALLEATCSEAVGFFKDIESLVLLESLENPDSTFTEISVSFWVQGEDDGISTFFGYAEDPDQTSARINGFTFGQSDGEFRAIVHDQIVDFPGIDVLDSMPHHVGISWEGLSGGGELKIYVDGVLRSTSMIGEFGCVFSAGPLALGQDLDDNVSPYGFDAAQALDGTIDEFAFFGRVLSQAEFVAQARATLVNDDYGRDVLDLDPILYWRLGESAGPVARNLGSLCASADGAYGTEVAFGSSTLAGDSCNDAIKLSKDTQSHVLLESLEPGSISTRVSVSFWVEGIDNGISHFFGYAESVVSPNAFTFGQNDGEFRAIVHDQIVDISGLDVLDGTPHHVGISWDGSNGRELKIYVDGLLESTMSLGSFNDLLTTGPFVIGQDFDEFSPPYGFDASQALDGTIDEFAVFDRILTDSEFQTLANSNVPASELIVDGSFDSSGFNSTTWLERSELDQGWRTHSGSWQNVSGEAVAGGGRLGQVNRVCGQSGQRLTLSFDWTPDANATGNELRLYYSLAGWINDTGINPTNDMMRLNSGDECSGLNENSDLVDLLTGDIFFAAGQTILSEEFVSGTAGLTERFSVSVDLSGYDLIVNDISDLEYFGIRFRVDEPTPGGTLDNVCVIDYVLGDVNRDGAVNLLDIGPFVGVLSAGDFQVEADINKDGSSNLLDIDGFIEILAGG